MDLHLLGSEEWSVVVPGWVSGLHKVYVGAIHETES